MGIVGRMLCDCNIVMWLHECVCWRGGDGVAQECMHVPLCAGEGGGWWLHVSACMYWSVLEGVDVGCMQGHACVGVGGCWLHVMW